MSLKEYIGGSQSLCDLIDEFVDMEAEMLEISDNVKKDRSMKKKEKANKNSEQKKK